jgi:RNA polymerase sigma factor (sigma-70 family)
MSDDAHDRTKFYRAIWAEDCETHYPRLRSYAWRLAGDVDAANDIVQDVVTKILRLVPDPAAVGDRMNYLLRSVHNRWADWVKERSHLKTVSLSDPDNKEVYAIAAPQRDADVDAETEQCRLEMSIVLRRLNQRERDVLTQFLEGYTCDEIAMRLRADRRVISYELNAVRTKVRYHLGHRLRGPKQPGGSHKDGR